MILMRKRRVQQRGIMDFSAQTDLGEPGLTLALKCTSEPMGTWPLVFLQVALSE